MSSEPPAYACPRCGGPLTENRQQGAGLQGMLRRTIYVGGEFRPYMILAALSGALLIAGLVAFLVNIVMTVGLEGAIGIFRRSTVVEAGGYWTETVGEDMELIVRLHRHCRERKQPYRISFIPDPIAWTEAPERVRVLGRQRDRWQRGLMQALARNRVMLLNPKYGRIGLVAFPYFWFLEGFGPVVEILGYVAFTIALVLGWVSMPYVIAFLLLAFFLGVALSAAAVALEELVFRRYTRMSDFGRLLVLAVLENFGYRQLLSLFRFRGVLSAVRGRKGWGKMDRHGTIASVPRDPEEGSAPEAAPAADATNSLQGGAAAAEAAPGEKIGAGAGV